MQRMYEFLPTYKMRYKIRFWLVAQTHFAFWKYETHADQNKFTFTYLADTFIQSDLLQSLLQSDSGYTIFISMCVLWELNTQPFALLPLSHRNTVDHIKPYMEDI